MFRCGQGGLRRERPSCYYARLHVSRRICRGRRPSQSLYSVHRSPGAGAGKTRGRAEAQARRSRSVLGLVPSGRRPAPPTLSGEKDAERQLLEAIDRHGEVKAARVALETALTEADRRLGELAEEGHLDVNVRDGRLVYSF